MRLRRERDLAKTKTKIIVPGHGGAPRLQPKRRQSRDRFLPLSHFCRSTRPVGGGRDDPLGKSQLTVDCDRGDVSVTIYEQ